jgi:hypothetical protein
MASNDDKLEGVTGNETPPVVSNSLTAQKEVPTLDSVPPEDRKKVEQFVLLRKSGVEAKVAAKAVGLSGRKYTQYGPVFRALLQEGRKPETKETEIKETPPGPGGNGPKDKPPEEQPYIEPPPTEMEKEIEDMIMKKAALARAVQRAQQIIMGPSMGTTSTPTQPPPQPPPTPEEKKDAFEELANAFESYDKARKKFKDVAEKFGYKFEDTYVTRDEHEKGIEEAVRKAFEQKTDDKSLETIKEIVNHAVDVMFAEGFGPVLRTMFARAIEARTGAEGETPPETKETEKKE